MGFNLIIALVDNLMTTVVGSVVTSAQIVFDFFFPSNSAPIG